MTIEKIVLDELQILKSRLQGIDTAIDSDFEDIAKSIEAKIKAVSIDRDEVKSLLFELADMLEPIHKNEAGTPERNQLMIDENIYCILDKILSLLKPVKTMSSKKSEYKTFHINKKYKTIIDRLETMEKLETQLKSIKYLDRGEVEKIFDDHYDEYENIYYIDEIITDICNLVVEEGDK